MFLLVATSSRFFAVSCLAVLVVWLLISAKSHTNDGFWAGRYIFFNCAGLAFLDAWTLWKENFLSLRDGVEGHSLSIDPTLILEDDLARKEVSFELQLRSATRLALSLLALWLELMLPLPRFLDSRVGSFFLIVLEIVGLVALDP